MTFSSQIIHSAGSNSPPHIHLERVGNTLLSSQPLYFFFSQTFRVLFNIATADNSPWRIPSSHLHTELIKEAHKQVSTAHPGRDKTYRLLRARYYWRGMLADVQRFIRNCHQCRRADVPRDKTPGLLHPLPIPERPWQHVTMDYKSQPKDKHGFDNVFVVVDRLSKQSVCTPCYKTVTAEDMAKMYLQHIYSLPSAD